MDVDLRLLRYFVAVAEELHFGRAAARLHITQQALSSGIQKLEKQLGAQLFLRSTRRVDLTPSGKRLLPDARDVLASIQRLAGNQRATSPQTIRLAVVAGADIIVPILDELDDRTLGAPLDIALVDLSSDDQAAGVLDGTVDIGIGRVAPVPPGITVTPLKIDPLMGLLPAGSVFASLPSVPVELATTNGPDDLPHWSSWYRYVSALRAAIGRPLPHTTAITGAAAVSLPIIISRAEAAGLIHLIIGVYASQAPAGSTLLPPAGLQPFYVWSLLTRTDDARPGVTAFVKAAMSVSAERGWLSPDPTLPGRPWLPDDDPHRSLLPQLIAAWEGRQD